MSRYISKVDEKRIMEAIHEAEENTSGEIRVHIQPRCKGEPIEVAKKVFDRLKMTRTEERNGVLFFVAYKDKKFTIIGDKGIDDVVLAEFWESIVKTVTDCFSEGRTADGLCDGIIAAGDALKEYFPYQSDDVNELNDEISYA